MRWMCSLSAALLLGVTTVRAGTSACEYVDGGIVRGPQTEKKIALEFTADEFVEGAPVILDELAARHLKASFFLTGRCARRAENRAIIARMIEDRHYVGPHSYSHPLLCPWTGKKRTLVTKEFFVDDLKQNLVALEKAGVQRTNIKYFLPPYEWYNEEVAAWTRESGLTLVNHSSGTRSAADYTEERSRNFVSSQAIYDSILGYEKQRGLNGHLLLLHLGAGPERKDKMHRRFGQLCDELLKRGYRLVTVDELLHECRVARGVSANSEKAAMESAPSARIFLPATVAASR